MNWKKNGKKKNGNDIILKAKKKGPVGGKSNYSIALGWISHQVITCSQRGSIPAGTYLDAGCSRWVLWDETHRFVAVVWFGWEAGGGCLDWIRCWSAGGGVVLFSWGCCWGNGDLDGIGLFLFCRDTDRPRARGFYWNSLIDGGGRMLASSYLLVIFAASYFLVSYLAPVLPSAVHYWPFDETNGTEVAKFGQCVTRFWDSGSCNI